MLITKKGKKGIAKDIQGRHKSLKEEPGRLPQRTPSELSLEETEGTKRW